MARLLVLDIDGTILDPSDIVTPIVRSAITAARQQGVEVALATGRRLRSTLPVVAELGIELPLVLYNGALVWSTAEQRALYLTPFNAATIATVIERAMRAHLPPVLLQGPGHGERIKLPDDLPAEAEDFIRGYVGPRQAETDRLSHAALAEEPDILTIDVFAPESRLREVTQDLTARGLSVYHHGPFMLGDVSVWAANLHMPGVSKANAVAWLAAQHDLSLADVVAVGDGDNDLPLLEAAGVGVAMGNAPAHVRERADVVVRGHDEDGVAEAIERFVLGVG